MIAQTGPESRRRGRGEEGSSKTDTENLFCTQECFVGGWLWYPSGGGCRSRYVPQQPAVRKCARRAAFWAVSEERLRTRRDSPHTEHEILLSEVLKILSVVLTTPADGKLNQDVPQPILVLVFTRPAVPAE